MKNYTNFLIEEEYKKLLLFLEKVNEAFFNFDAIYERIKKFVMNVLENLSDPFKKLFNLWNSLKFNRKIAYIFISVMMIGCGVSKQEILKNFGYDKLAVELTGEIDVERNRVIKHRVQRGENLLYIANLYDVLYEYIVQKNQLKTEVIQPGQVLLIPSQREIELYKLDEYPEEIDKIEKKIVELEKDSTVATPKTTSIKTVLKDGFFFEESEGEIKSHTVIIDSRIRQLEIADFRKVNAIVLHRTATKNLEGTLRGFANRKIGTHFLIDYDGKIYQTASVNKMTCHVGEIRSRAYVEGTASTEEIQNLKEIGGSFRKVHLHEIKKKYPERYPHNSDAIGIEVMGGYSSGKWEQLTQNQIESVKFLLSILKKNFNLKDKDIYAHEIISYKTAGEGMNILNQIKK